jgi:hypothetical protein
MANDWIAHGFWFWSENWAEGLKRGNDIGGRKILEEDKDKINK